MSHQEAIVALFRSAGCVVWVFSENRKTRLPPGFCDFQFSHPRLKGIGAWESKQRNEDISEAQLQFEHDWASGHGLYGRGDIEAAKLWLEKRGLLK